MHAWAQVRHRHDSGAHASRYVFPGMPEKRVGSGTKTVGVCAVVVRLRASCAAWPARLCRASILPPPAPRGCSGLRLPPASPRHGGGSIGRLRDLHGRDRASARRHVWKAETARRTGPRIVQPGTLRASIPYGVSRAVACDQEYLSAVSAAVAPSVMIYVSCL